MKEGDYVQIIDGIIEGGVKNVCQIKKYSKTNKLYYCKILYPDMNDETSNVPFEKRELEVISEKEALARVI